MKRHRLLVAVTVLSLGVLMPAGAYAQANSTSLSVSASVQANCTISTSAVTFGAYDPLGANATANLDAAGTVTVACTKGSVPTISLGGGSNASGSLRQMSNGGTGLLAYQLYKDAGRTSLWGENTDAFTAPAAPSKTARAYTVYGRVAAGLDPEPGSYADSVQAVVNF